MNKDRIIAIQYVVFYNTIIIYYNFILLKYGGSDGKESTCNAGDVGSIPALERAPEGDTLQYPYLGNPKDRRAWPAKVHGAAKVSDMTECLNNIQF